MSAANWAYALGAAILQGSRSYQEALQLHRALAQQDFENKRQTQADTRAQRTSDNEALIQQDRIAELPKVHARGDMQDILSREGYNAFNNPAFVKASSDAGVPLQTKPLPTFLDSTKIGPSAQPIMPVGQQSMNMPATEQFSPNKATLTSPIITPDTKAVNIAQEGMAPNTGAVIPDKYQFEHAQMNKGMAMDNFTMQLLQDALGQGGGGMGAFERGPDGKLVDSQRNRQLGTLLGPQDPITHVFGPASTSLPNEQARAEMKAQIPSATMQRFNTGTANAVKHMSSALVEYEKLFPGIGDPQQNAKYNTVYPGEGGAIIPDYLKARGEGIMYGVRDNPYNKAIQDANLGGLQEIANLVPGRMNPQIIAMAQQHIQKAGHETHLATFNRMTELRRLLQDNLETGIHPQQGIKDALSEGTGPLAPPPQGTPQGAPPPNPGANVPNPGTPQAAGPKTATAAEVNAFARARNIAPKDAAQQLIQAGYRIQ